MLHFFQKHSKKALVKFLIWRMRHIRDKSFVLILAGFVGVISGFAAVSLKGAVHFIHSLLYNEVFVLNKYAHLLAPLLGISLTVLTAKYVFKEKLGHGITSILYAISKKSSIISKGKMISRMVTSALTVGFGGSVGLEAPIVVTGSAIGSNIANIMHLNYKKRTLLIGCGAAGAISGIFNSPVAGVIFSMEVILSNVTIAGFIPLLISSVFASLVSLTLLGDDVLFSFRLTDDFKASDAPFYILLGVVSGLVSVYFSRVTFKIEAMLTNVKDAFPRVLMGGIALGLIAFIFPPLFGEGYETIKLLLTGNENSVIVESFLASEDNKWSITLFVLGLVLIKPVASALTIGSGGSGGIFAPSLFLGGVTGFLFAFVLNSFFSDSVSISNFTLIGMCGVMSGVLHAPLTAMFLIAEITSGYELFVPLMLVSAISYTTSNFFEKHSFYTKHLFERGDMHKTKDRLILSQIDISKLIEKDLLQIRPEATLQDLTNLVKISKRNIFPVVDDKERLLGIVTLDDVRNIMFNDEKRNSVLVNSLMHDPPAHVSSNDSMSTVMSKFELTGAWNLPVIDENRYIGFLSKSRIFNTYRTHLQRHDKD